MSKLGQLHKTKTLTTFLLILTYLLLSGPVYADETQSLSDRFAIADMVSQYAYTWDSKNAEAYANLFTEDGVLEVFLPNKPEPWAKRESRQAIHDSAQNSFAKRLAGKQTRHNQSALIFHSLSADSAETQNMVLITHQTAEDKAPVVKFSGIYKDKWRKTDQGWLISHRTLYLDPILK